MFYWYISGFEHGQETASNAAANAARHKSWIIVLHTQASPPVVVVAATLIVRVRGSPPERLSGTTVARILVVVVVQPRPCRVCKGRAPP